MLKVVNNGISLTRGDTATFRLQIKNQDGTDYEITPDDQVLFTVKRSPNDEEVVIQKAAANNCITIVPRERQIIWRMAHTTMMSNCAGLMDLLRL